MLRRSAVAIVVACALGAGWLLAAPAALASGTQVVADCNAHGRLTQQYAVSQLRAALSTMPADIKEYTDCYDVIQRTLLTQVGSLHGSGTPGANASSGSLLPTGVIIALVVLGLGAASLGAVAIRRRH